MAPVSTVPIRPLRPRRLCCVWIHLPASEKSGVQVERRTSPLSPCDKVSCKRVEMSCAQKVLFPLAVRHQTLCTPPCALT